MRSRVSEYLPELILIANAGAFAVLLAELLIMEHTHGIQRVAPATAAIGMGLCVVAVVLPARLRLAPAILLAALSLTGIIGFAQHMDERDDGFAGLFQSNEDDDDRDDNSGRGNRDDDRDRDDDDDDDEEPPPLAPLGLSGTALLSAIAAFAGPGRRER